jgi:hypothetical protein
MVVTLPRYSGTSHNADREAFFVIVLVSRLSGIRCRPIAVAGVLVRVRLEINLKDGGDVANR